MTQLLILLAKIIKIVFREAGERLEAKLRIPLLNQEITDSKKALNEAKNELSRYMSQRDALKRKVQSKESEIARNLQCIRKLMDDGNRDKAENLAPKVAAQKNDLKPQQKRLSTMDSNVEKLEAKVKEKQKTLKILEDGLEAVKATAKVQSLETMVDGKLGEASRAAELLKEAQDDQQEFEDSRKNRESLDQDQGEELTQELIEAGLIESDEVSGEDILAELEASNDSPQGEEEKSWFELGIFPTSQVRWITRGTHKVPFVVQKYHILYI